MLIWISGGNTRYNTTVPKCEFLPTHVWNSAKDGNVTGISILMQNGTITMGIMFGKMYPVHTVLFNQYENFVNRPHYVL